MAKDNTLLLLLGLGAVYFLTRPGSAFAYPPGTQPKPATGSGGGSGGGFSVGGGSGGGAGSTSYSPTPGYTIPVTQPSQSTPLPTSPTQYGLQPTAPGMPVGPVTNTDVCDPSSYYYDPSQCAETVPLEDTTSTYLQPVAPSIPDYSNSYPVDDSSAGAGDFQSFDEEYT